MRTIFVELSVEADELIMSLSTLPLYLRNPCIWHDKRWNDVTQLHAMIIIASQILLRVGVGIAQYV